jgi:hypothetical protein
MADLDTLKRCEQLGRRFERMKRRSAMAGYEGGDAN